MLKSIYDSFGFCSCHQICARSFIISGNQLPFCARCTGIHLGFIFASVYNLFTGKWKSGGRPDQWAMAILVLTSQTMVLDGFTSYAGLRDTDNLTRVITGLSMGAAVAILLPWLTKVVDRTEVNGSYSWKEVSFLLCIFYIFGFTIPSFTDSLVMYHLISIASVVGQLLFAFLCFNLLFKLLINNIGSAIVKKPNPVFVASFQFTLMLLIWNLRVLSGYI